MHWQLDVLNMPDLESEDMLVCWVGKHERDIHVFLIPKFPNRPPRLSSVRNSLDEYLKYMDIYAYCCLKDGIEWNYDLSTMPKLGYAWFLYGYSDGGWKINSPFEIRDTPMHSYERKCWDYLYSRSNNPVVKFCLLDQPEPPRHVFGVPKLRSWTELEVNLDKQRDAEHIRWYGKPYHDWISVISSNNVRNSGFISNGDG